MPRQVNIRGLGDDQYAALQAAAKRDGVTVAEIARRLLTAGSDAARTAAEADLAMIRAGIPKWSRDKILAIITGATTSGVPGVW